MTQYIAFRPLATKRNKVFSLEQHEDYGLSASIGADTFELTTATFGGKRYNIVCDEDGKLKNRVPAIFTQNDVIVGDVLIAGPINDDGDFEDVTDEDLENILNSGYTVCVHEAEICTVLIDDMIL